MVVVLEKIVASRPSVSYLYLLSLPSFPVQILNAGILRLLWFLLGSSPSYGNFCRGMPTKAVVTKGNIMRVELHSKLNPERTRRAIVSPVVTFEIVYTSLQESKHSSKLRFIFVCLTIVPNHSEVEKVSEPRNVVPRNFLGLIFQDSFQEK